MMIDKGRYTDDRKIYPNLNYCCKMKEGHRILLNLKLNSKLKTNKYLSYNVRKDYQMRSKEIYKKNFNEIIYSTKDKSNNPSLTKLNLDKEFDTNTKKLKNNEEMRKEKNNNFLHSIKINKSSPQRFEKNENFLKIIDKILSQKKEKQKKTSNQINCTISVEDDFFTKQNSMQATDFSKSKSLNIPNSNAICDKKFSVNRNVNKIINEKICFSKTETKSENLNSLKSTKNIKKQLSKESNIAQIINGEMYYSIKKMEYKAKKVLNLNKNIRKITSKKTNLNAIINEKKNRHKMIKECIVTSTLETIQSNEKNSTRKDTMNDTINGELSSSDEGNKTDFALSYKMEENIALTFRRHSIAGFLSEYRSIKLNKLMFYNSGNWNKEYTNIFTKSLKMAAIQNYITKLSSDTNRQTSFSLYNYENKKREKVKSSKITEYAKVEKEKSRNGEKLKMIKSNGSTDVNMYCHFKHSFVISLHITELFLEDLLMKQNLLILQNEQNHCRITVKLNDFIIDEESLRWNKIKIESSSKLGLIKVLDKIDNTFPYWDIWKNGALMI